MTRPTYPALNAHCAPHKRLEVRVLELAKTEKAFGPDHPNVAHDLDDQAQFYYEQYRCKRPVEYRSQAIG